MIGRRWLTERREPAPRRGSTALVISGGGCRGAFAVGAVQYIYRQFGREGWFSIVGGCSTGALMTPFVGLLGSPDTTVADRAMGLLVKQYTSVRTRDILDKRNLIDFVQTRDFLSRSTPLRNRVTDALDEASFELLRRADMPYCYVVYTNYQTGKLVRASPRDAQMTRERFIDAMIASASVPVFMEPTIIDGQDCYDGGARDVVPLSHAVELGAQTIVPIVLDPDDVPPSKARFRHLDQILFRTLDIMLDETGKNDLQIANLINLGTRAREDILRVLSRRPLLRRRVRAVFDREEYRELFGPEKKLVHLVEGLRPDEKLTEDPLKFNPVQMRVWMQLGERKAQSVLRDSPF